MLVFEIAENVYVCTQLGEHVLFFHVCKNCLQKNLKLVNGRRDGIWWNVFLVSFEHVMEALQIGGELLDGLLGELLVYCLQLQ